MDARGRSVEVVFCYARKDQKFLGKLKEHLSLLLREKRITLWADIDLDAGIDWRQEVHYRLDTARMVLLLISPSFIASDYCYGVEMQRALERHERGEAHVIPILVRPVVGWQSAPFGILQVLPKNARPISLWSDSDKACHNVVEEIKKVIEKMEEEEGIVSNSKAPTDTTNSPLSTLPTSRKRSSSQEENDTSTSHHSSKYNIKNDSPAQSQVIGDYSHVEMYNYSDQSESEPLRQSVSNGNDHTQASYYRKRKRIASTWLRMRLPIRVLAVVALVAMLLVPLSAFFLSRVHTTPSISSQAAHLDGWLFHAIYDYRWIESTKGA